MTSPARSARPLRKPAQGAAKRARGPRLNARGPRPPALKAVGVIPARMASTRFPGKPLIPLLGKPMIWHVWRRSRLSRSLGDVVIATCDEEIRRAAEGFGARVVMTSSRHARANDRVAEAFEAVGGDVVLNIQGDEPLLHPALIDDILARFAKDPGVGCLNPVAVLKDPAEIASRNTVKVVFDLEGRALYFSRHPIPSDLAQARSVPVYRQVPILGFRRDYFRRLSALPETPLERQESVDMMRAIEHGLPVHVLLTPRQTIGVDTPEDRARAEAALAADPVTRRYMRPPS